MTGPAEPKKPPIKLKKRGPQPEPGIDSLRERQPVSPLDIVGKLTLEHLPDNQRDVVERALGRLEEERHRAFFRREHDRRSAEALLDDALQAVNLEKGWELDRRIYDVALMFASLDHHGLDGQTRTLHHGAGLVIATVHERLSRESQGKDLADLANELARSSYSVATLERKAIYEPLTGLHEDFDTVRDRLVAESDRSQREGDPDEVTVVAEVDFISLKGLNSKYGNNVVDAQILRPLGAQLRQHFRSHDIRCRFGGDELTLIITRVKANQVLKVLEHIRLVIEECPFSDRITPGDVKVRIGAFVLKKEDLAAMNTTDSTDFVSELRHNALLAAEEVKRRMTSGDSNPIALWDASMTANQEIAWEVMVDRIMRANAAVIAELYKKFGQVTADVFKQNLIKAVRQAAEAAVEHPIEPQ